MILRKASQFLFVGFVLMFFRPYPTVLATSGDTQVHDFNEVLQTESYDPYTLIADVNALRAANGLPALNPDPILMSVSQAHADYMASIGTVTHYSADGSRPFQRSLAAGYPVAGDLSLGGFHSENIIAGQNMTPAEAVSLWTGDEAHLNTMLSTKYVDIGAGVSIIGDTVYYVIDTSRKSGSAVLAYTPASNGTPFVNIYPLISTIFPNTPAADGSITHVVRSGETMWLIAITYGVKIDEIISLNNLAKDSPIYPGQTLIIKKASMTLTPTLDATGTPQLELTSSPTPSLTNLFTHSPDETETAGKDSASTSGLNLLMPLIIVVGALMLAGLVTVNSGRRRQS